MSKLIHEPPVMNSEISWFKIMHLCELIAEEIRNSGSSYIDSYKINDFTKYDSIEELLRTVIQFIFHCKCEENRLIIDYNIDYTSYSEDECN